MVLFVVVFFVSSPHLLYSEHKQPLSPKKKEGRLKREAGVSPLKGSVIAGTIVVCIDGMDLVWQMIKIKFSSSL